MGPFDARGTSLVPSNEAPILYDKTQSGWSAVVTAYIPRDFLLWPQLRLFVFDGERRAITEDLYTSLGKPPNFRLGRVFNSESEFLQVSTSGEHAYVVRTLIWLLPEGGAPKLLLDAPGLVDRIQRAEGREKQSGFWIQRELYDGVHADTKGHKSEFWLWDDSLKTLRPRPS